MTKQHVANSLHLRAVQSFWAPQNAPHLEIRTTLNSTVPYAPHLHSYLSLGFILQGETCLSCAGDVVVARQHDMVTLEPRLVHSCNPLHDQTRSYHMLYVNPLWIYRQLFCDSKDGSIRVLHRVYRDMNLSSALQESITEALHDKFLVSAAALNRLETAICRILELTCRLDETESVLPEPLTEAAHLLAGDSPAQVADMATLSGLSREGFIRAFHRSTGLTPGKYGHCLRIEEGRRLLRLGCSIAETALATGYADQSHFHRMFVRYCAATPRQYAHERSLLFKKDVLP